MNSFSFLVLNSVILAGSHLWAGDYSLDDKCNIYSKTSMERPTIDRVLSISDPEWEALNGPSLVDKINRVGDGKRATRLAASSIEFKYLTLEPTSNLENLQKRREIIENLEANFEDLDPLIIKLVDLEHVFTHILQKEKTSITGYHLYNLFFQGSVVMTFSLFNMPYLARHFLYDWQTLNANSGKRAWFCVMVLIKVVGAVGTMYQSGQFILNTGKQIISKVKKDDRFVLEFAQAMRSVQEIIKIIKQNQILADTLTVLIDFDNAPKKYLKLQEILTAAEKRLAAEDSWMVMAMWAAKDSPSLHDQIKSGPMQQIFVILYNALARLDAYLAVARIIKYSKEQNIPITFPTYTRDAQRPSFLFSELKNPLIPKCVPYNIEGNGHLVFNGPSTCGKTGAMKAIIFAFVTAQSLGIVFASEAEIALVNSIGVHCNVGDNIDIGHSSFKAQHASIKKLLDLAERQQKPGRTLLLIDEPYNGVGGTPGENVAGNLMEKLIVFPNLTFLLSSHYKKPTEYENEDESVVQNWHPELIEDDNRFIRTFKINKGTAAWWYDDPEKAAAFIRQVCEEE